MSVDEQQTVALIHRKLLWLEDRATYSHPATWIVPVPIGTLLAASFGLWAVYAVRRCEYGSMLPLPLVHVGVTPLLQMIVIPSASTAVCRSMAIRECSRTDVERSS